VTTLPPHWSIANSVDILVPCCVLQNSLRIGRDLNSPVCYVLNELCSLIDVFCLPLTSSWKINHPLVLFLSSYHNLTWHWRRLNYREHVEWPPLYHTAQYNCHNNPTKATQHHSSSFIALMAHCKKSVLSSKRWVWRASIWILAGFDDEYVVYWLSYDLFWYSPLCSDIIPPVSHPHSCALLVLFGYLHLYYGCYVYMLIACCCDAMLLCWIHWMSEDVFTWKSFVPLVYLNCFVLSSTCFFCSQPNLSPFNLSHHWKTYYVLVRWYPILRQQWYFVYWLDCLMCCSLFCWSVVVPVALMMDRLSQTHCMVSVLMLVSHKFCAAACIFLPSNYMLGCTVLIVW
jgi:hypothetical protein